MSQRREKRRAKSLCNYANQREKTTAMKGGSAGSEAAVVLAVRENISVPI